MNRYIRRGICSVEEIFPLIEEHYGKNLPRPLIHGYPVGVSSLRMKTFQQMGLSCKRCGLEASFFAVEDFHKTVIPRPHLNLYGVNSRGEEVLFTHDHILARGLGGKDTIDNVQTMCSPCNNKKGQSENPQNHKNPNLKVKLKVSGLDLIAEFLTQHSLE